jgi:nicotinamide-nucleotide amidase
LAPPSSSSREFEPLTVLCRERKKHLGGYSRPMTAEIVSVGTELLLGDIVDTNAAELGKAFAQHGLAHHHRQTVGDNQDRLTACLKLALSRSDVVFTIGGLGPTEDDMTRDGIAAALGVPLIPDEEVEEHLRALFAKRSANWTGSQNRQAMKPAGAEIVPNPNGTAPGLICRSMGKIVVALPGPRNEFVPMITEGLAPLWRQIGSGEVIHSRTLRFIGIGESVVAETLADLMEGTNPTAAPYAKTAEVHVRITAKAPDVEAAEVLLAPMEAEMRSRLGRYIYGTDEETIASSCLSLLRASGATLGVVESCTGGGLGRFLTETPGSSDVFQGGVITYSNALKTRLVGVSEDTLAAYGAVSPQTAREMAAGGREALGVDYCLSVTGIAGPDGGTDEKPVGLVFVACAGPDGVTGLKTQWIGTREAIRERAQKTALNLLRRVILRLEA